MDSSRLGRNLIAFGLGLSLVFSGSPAKVTPAAPFCSKTDSDFATGAISVPLGFALSSRALAKGFVFRAAVALLALVPLAAQTPIVTEENPVVRQQGIQAARVALGHIQKDHWGTERDRGAVMLFLQKRLDTNDFKVTRRRAQTAFLADPPANTIYLNADLFPSRSEEERAAIIAHETYHGMEPQRRRTRFMMWWDAFHAAIPSRQIALTRAYHRSYKQNLAALVRNEYEALSYELRYRLGLARSLGYRDMRKYFTDLADRPGDPEASLHRSLAQALAAWDLTKPQTIRFREDDLLLGLLLSRFAPPNDTRILSEIAAAEGAREGSDVISHSWFLSWLKDPSYYNPVIPRDLPAYRSAPGRRGQLLLPLNPPLLRAA